MRHNKLKKLILITVIFCISSVPVITYAQDTSNLNGKVVEQSNVQIQNNWLTQEVANQLKKDVKNLTQQDFLSITKIKLKNERINDEIPKEIGLLKNLEYLDLNNSNIKWEVPEAIGDLPKLTYLDLGSNDLTKLPNNISKKAIDGKYTYCDLEDNKFRLDEGLYFLKGKWCYLDRNGERLKEGTQTINGKDYQITGNGDIREGWENDTSNNRYYYDKTSGLVKNDWKLISGNWYYFNQDGAMQKGWQTIKGVKYYLADNGTMLTGWQSIDNKWYYFASNGAIQYGWLVVNNKRYYLDTNTGIMVTGDSIIDGKKYRFGSDGTIQGNIWIDQNTYVNPNGESVNTSYNFSHSNTNFQLFKYMTDVNNEASVDRVAVALHDGITSNNCVYFSSEALRRIGINIPKGTCNTYQFENILKGLGFTYSYDLSQLKPGDIVFTNGYSHVYIFMGWDKDGYAYIVDNQGTSYGGTLHRRSVYQDTSTTDRATHFFYYPY